MWYEREPYGGVDDREMLRFRDEDHTNLRLIIRPGTDGEAAAELIVLATDEDWLKIGLDDMVVDCLIEALVKARRKAAPRRDD
jgi:hypothetical protein